MIETSTQRQERRRWIRTSDRFLGILERANLAGRDRQAMPDRLWKALAWLADQTQYAPDPPNTYVEAHGYVLALQSGAGLLECEAAES